MSVRHQPGTKRLVATSGLLVVSLLAVIGCGPGPTTVSGVVTLDGKPLAEALVRFFPEGAAGQTAAVYTDSAGRYRATVSPAPLRVAISALKIVGQEKNDLVSGGPMLDITEESVPPRYSDPKKSVLSIQPPAHRHTTCDFKLSTQPSGRL